MSEKKRLFSRFSELFQNNGFLKVISVLLAVVVWIYILYVINPVNDKEFNRISVDLSYEGSIPERNGYMYLLTDTNLTVSVNVSGSRSELFNLTAADIKASLNLDPITTAGTHSVAVNISTKNKNLEITDYNPKSFTIEFASVATRTLPVEWQPAGTLPEGYVIDETTVSPKEITISGPAATVESIDKVYVSVPVTNVKENTSGTYDISIVNKNNENVDRRFLTISDTKAESTLSLHYETELKPEITITNSFGGNESAYITVTLDPTTVKAIGNEKILGTLEFLSLGTLDTSAYTESGVYPLQIPATEGVTYSEQTINATVSIDEDTGTKDITFHASSILRNNFPATATVTIKSPITVRIRGMKADLDKLSVSNLSCQIDYTDKREDGSYPIIVYALANNNLSFGVVGSPALTEGQVEIYEARSY